MASWALALGERSGYERRSPLMATVAQIVAELRRRGITVHEWAGWNGRGNEGVAHIDAKGGIIHHTGSNYGSAYAGLVVSTRPDLFGGCLCNFAGNENGSLTVLASGLAWHAAPSTGPSLGALAPYGRNLNRNTVGLEIVYPGSSPMRNAQYRTALVWAKTVADLCAGGNLEAIRAHAEASSSGKWDPGYATGKTINMTAFRRDAAGSATPVIAPRGPEMRVLLATDTGRVYTATDTEVAYISDPAVATAAVAAWGEVQKVTQRQVDLLSFDANARRARGRLEIADQVAERLNPAAAR